MRALSVFCIVVSAGVHGLAYWLLDLGSDRVVAEERVVPLTLMTEIELEAQPDEIAAAAPPAPAPAAPAPAAEAKEELAKDEVAAWRAPGAEVPKAQVAAVEDAPAPTAEPKQEEPSPVPAEQPAPVPVTPEPSIVKAPAAPEPKPTWRPGPPPGLRLPQAIMNGKPAADLVIDPRDRTFVSRARELGMQFILFQDGSLGFYLELIGDDLRTARRKTEVDGTVFSRRARDLAGVRAFDRLRDDLAERYGIDPKRCRLAALVPLSVDQAFRAEETAALATLGRSAGEVLALCGVLTGDSRKPLRIDHALTADGRWMEVMP